MATTNKLCVAIWHVNLYKKARSSGRGGGRIYMSQIAGERGENIRKIGKLSRELFRHWYFFSDRSLWAANALIFLLAMFFIDRFLWFRRSNIFDADYCSQILSQQ